MCVRKGCGYNIVNMLANSRLWLAGVCGCRGREGDSGG